jgi:hypothetical protein
VQEPDIEAWLVAQVAGMGLVQDTSAREARLAADLLVWCRSRVAEPECHPTSAHIAVRWPRETLELVLSAAAPEVGARLIGAEGPLADDNNHPLLPFAGLLSEFVDWRSDWGGPPEVYLDGIIDVARQLLSKSWPPEVQLLAGGTELGAADSWNDAAMHVTDEAFAPCALPERLEPQCGGRFDAAKAGNGVECPIRRDDHRQAVPNCRGGVHRIPAAEAVDVRDQTESRLQNPGIEVMEDAQLRNVTCLSDG